MARNKYQYSKKEKLDILKKLRANDFNKSKTARQNGVSVPSIEKWEKELGDQLAEVEPVEARIDSLVPLTEEMDKRYEEYIIEALDLRIELIREIKKNIHKVRSPLMGAQILKTIDESILSNFKAYDPEGKETGGQTKSLSIIYKQIYNEAAN